MMCQNNESTFRVVSAARDDCESLENRRRKVQRIDVETSEQVCKLKNFKGTSH